MSTLERLAVFAVLFSILPSCAQTSSVGQNPRLGQPIAPADIAPWDISIGPDGSGLPPGSGTARQGEPVYVARCQACHGEKGAGKPNDALVGGLGTLVAGKMPVKTVGSYWPYATTLWDYINRAMPYDRPGSLSADEVYAVTAFVLHLNGIVGERDVISQATLPRVQMPNRDGFVREVKP